MINRLNFLLFQVIKRTYLEGSLLLQMVMIVNIYKVTLLYFLIFINGASFSQPNKLICIVYKEHTEITLFTCFYNRTNCKQARLSADGTVFSRNHLIKFGI